VQVKGDDDGLGKAVEKIKSVVNVEKKEDGTWEIEAAPGKDTRPAVARALVQGGYDLLELRSLDLSLEDIFLQLTREEPEPPQMASGEDMDTA
jgi:ABC-2 type transport system ATP-binding protein